MSDTQKILILNLNSSKEGEEATGTSKESLGIEISEHLQKSMLRMTGKFLKEATGTVDYKALRNSEEFRDYCSLANRLEKVDLSSFSEPQLLVFFINVYNALTVHSICEIQKTSDIGTTLDVPNFWGTHAYNIGGFVFTLDDIEHGILRGNRSHPSTGRQVLEAKEPRAKYSLRKVDPRIHFALNCGAKSCPMVRVYNCANLEKALEGATKSYLTQEVSVDGKDSTLKIPQILEWYLKDFAETQMEMLKWIEPYAEASVQKAIQSLLAANKEDTSASVQYFYDWSLNKA